MNSGKKQSKSKKNSNILFISLILVIFVMVTGLLVVNMYMSTSTNIKADKVIDITYNAPAYEPAKGTGSVNHNGSDPESSSSDTLADTSNTVSVSSTSQPGETAGNSSQSEESSENIKDIITVLDSDKMWSIKTDVNIFEHGDDNVKSDGTGEVDYVIAPGTKNDYIFSVSNNKAANIKYYLEITGGNDSDYEIPVQLEIIGPDGESLTGDEILIKDLKDIKKKEIYMPEVLKIIPLSGNGI